MARRHSNEVSQQFIKLYNAKPHYIQDHLAMLLKFHFTEKETQMGDIKMSTEFQRRNSSKAGIQAVRKDNIKRILWYVITKGVD